MMSVVCYCDSCQEGSRQIEALTNAVPILGPDGGTAYVLYRKDRVKYLKGAELLKGYRIDEKSTTSRVVAACCNSAMVMKFDDAKHWVPVYRGRFQGDVPPLQWRICTKFKPGNARIPNDIPSSPTYPAGFMITRKDPIVQRLGHRPFTAVTRVRLPLGSLVFNQRRAGRCGASSPAATGLYKRARARRPLAGTRAAAVGAGATAKGARLPVPARDCRH